MNLQASYATYGHTEDNPDNTINSTFLNKELDSRIEAVFGAIGPLSGSALGVQVGNRRYSALGDDSAYLFPTQTHSEAAYVFSELPIGSDLNLQLAGRMEQVHISGTPASNVFTGRDFSPISGSAGLLWNASDNLKFGLTVSTAGRAPAQTELFARGGHDGPQTFETGDPNLKIERANALEAAVRTHIGGIAFEGALWGNQFSNYIYGNLTGRTCDDDGNCIAGDGNELKELNYAQRGASFWGFEGKVTAPLFDIAAGGLSQNLLTDYVRATFANGLGNVPRIQPFRVGGGLSWFGDAFDASFMVMGVGDQNQVGAFESATPGYVDVDAQLGWRPWGKTGPEIGLVGHNLADQVERDAVALNNDVVVMPGRNIRLVLRQSL